jgi:hypothetical protein
MYVPPARVWLTWSYGPPNVTLQLSGAPSIRLCAWTVTTGCRLVTAYWDDRLQLNVGVRRQQHMDPVRQRKPRIPTPLRAENACGPRAAWYVLRQRGRRARSARLFHLTRWHQRNGAYAISLAVALAEYGLRVEFHTDHDPTPTRLERSMYARAAQLGIPIRRPLRTSSLVRAARNGHSPIVLFEEATSDETAGRYRRMAHFSVVLADQRRIGALRTVSLSDGWSLIHRLDEKRGAPGCYRQTILVLSGQAAV